MNRRELLQGVGAVVLIQANRSQETRPVKNTSLAGVKALVFDTFGTVVDWRGSITQKAKPGAKPGAFKSTGRDLPIVACRLRARRWTKFRKGQLPWTKLDDLHRALLEDLLKEFHIEGLTEAEKDHWNRVWHRLKPWPDSVAGLTRLKKKYLIAPFPMAMSPS